MSLPAAPASRRKHGRVRRVADRQLGRLEDLVPVQVGHRDLGRGREVQVVAGDDVHLVFLVRDLPGAPRRRRVDDDRRPDLGEAVLGGVDVEEPRDQRPLEPRARALVHREAGARDLGAADVVDDVERLAQLPVRLPGPGRAIGVGRLVRRRLAPAADRDVRLLAADRDVGVRGVGDAEQEVLELGLGGRELGVDGLDPLAGPRGGRPQLGDLGPVGARAAADRLADLLRRRVALGLEGVGLGLQPATRGVDLDRPVDDRRVLALVDRALPDPVRFLAQPLDADAHAIVSPCSPAAFSRPITKSRSRLASSQPARGPFGRPRKAR